MSTNDKILTFIDDEQKPYPMWDTKKLKEIAVVKMGQSPDSKSYSEDSSQNVLIQGNADMKNGKVVPRIYTSEGSKFCSPNDIIMSVRAPVGALAKSDIEACIGRGVCAITANDYVYQYLGYFDESGGWDKISQGSTFEAVSSNDVNNLVIPLPSLPEQQKIAEFFSALDERIELQSRKVEILREQKRGYQQRVFNRELAFTDDNGNPYPEWEETTLAPFLAESRIKGNTGKEARKLTVKLYGKGVVPKKDSVEGSTNTQYYMRKAGQLIYGKLDFLNGAFGLIPEDLDGYETTLDAPSFDLTNINSIFLLELVSRREFYYTNGRKANGTRIAKRIHPEDFLTMPVLLPSLPEQGKIAEFFSALDENITLNERKIVLLKEQKRGYLQGIFGSITTPTRSVAWTCTGKPEFLFPSIMGD